MSEATPKPESRTSFEKRVRRRIVGRTHIFVVVAQPALRRVVVRELRSLGIDAAPDDVGARFVGSIGDGYRACLFLRAASACLVRVVEASVGAYQQLYRAVSRVPWDCWVGAATEIGVRVTLFRSRIHHEGEVERVVRDAIAGAGGPSTGGGRRGADGVMEGESSQPHVGSRETEGGDDTGTEGTPPTSDGTPARGVELRVRVAANRCTVDLNLGGAPLHRRGYRLDPGRAPIREDVAAGILQLVGYDGSVPLYDAMTGSGTFAAEALLIAGRVPPRIGRAFAFEQLPWFRRRLWEHVVRSARRDARRPTNRIIAADRDPRAIARALQNVRRAWALFGADGAGDHVSGEAPNDDLPVEFRHADLFDVPPTTGAGIVVANPPYGARLPGSDAFRQRLIKELPRRFPEMERYVLLPVERGDSRAFRDGSRYTVNMGLPIVRDGLIVHGGRSISVSRVV